MSSKLFIFFLSLKKKSIKGSKDAVIKYLGHNRFQLSTPFNYCTSMAVFLLLFLSYKVLAGNCKIKLK